MSSAPVNHRSTCASISLALGRSTRASLLLALGLLAPGLGLFGCATQPTEQSARPQTPSSEVAPAQVGPQPQTGTQPSSAANAQSLANTAQATSSARRAPAPMRIPSIDDPLPDMDGWRRLLARDKRLEFTARTATDARRQLAEEDVSISRRAVCWMAIGCSGAVSSRVEMQELARKGTGIERLAAILALGELKIGVESALLPLVDAGKTDIGECALLALLRSDRPSSRRRVDEIAHDPQHLLSRAATDLLVFALDESSSTPTRAAVMLLELRWYAARRYGLVDHQAWPGLVVNTLCDDDEFMHEVALRSAARLRKPGIKDYLLFELRYDKGEGRLRAAVTGMPLELGQLVQGDYWLPKDLDEWSVMLDEIDRRSLAPLAIDVHKRAADVNAIHYRATALLARAGKVPVASFIEADLSNVTADERTFACDAMATTGDPSWTKRLQVLREDEDAHVRAAALIGLVRLGDKPSVTALNEILKQPKHADHATVIAEMCRVAHDPLVAVMLEDVVADAKGDERTEIAATLCLAGRMPGRTIVRKALGAEPPPYGAVGARWVRALRRHGSAEDIEVLKLLFPREDDPEMNLELALSLLELGDPSILPILRAAVWNLDWSASILAAGVLADISGIGNLRELLDLPPPEATSNDIRRVGFAIGVWGGLAQVEELSRVLRYNSGHPALQGVLLGALSARTE